MEQLTDEQIESMLKEPTFLTQVDVNALINHFRYYKQLSEKRGKALEWYADEKNWGSIEEYGAWVSDGGERACQALQEDTP